MTLGDFLPTGELVRKTRKSRRQRLSLTLGGLEGVVSSRIPLWSDRDLGTDMHETTRRPSWRRRWRLFAGLRGQVSSHFPTHVFRPYRTYRASPTHLRPRQVAPSVRVPRPLPEACAPPQPASKPPAASASPPRRPATRHVTAPPPKSTTAPPAACAALAPGVEPPPPSQRFRPDVAGESPRGVPERIVTSRRQKLQLELIAYQEVVRLRGTYQSAPLVVTLTREGWRDCPYTDGVLAVHWVLTKALASRHKRPGPLAYKWVRKGEWLPRNEAPTDYDKVAALASTGWEFEATMHQPFRLFGGMDNAQDQGANADAQQGPAPESAARADVFDPASLSDADYLHLDAAVTELMAGRGDPNARFTPLARHLLAPVQPEEWGALTGICVAEEVSPARILMLRLALHTNADVIRAMPLAPWITASELVSVRFCDVDPTELGWAGGSMHEARALISSELPGIEGIASAPGFDWETLRSSVKVDGELTSSNSGCGQFRRCYHKGPGFTGYSLGAYL